MNRKHIAVDFDGVLFDHVPYVLRGFRDAYGIDLAAEGLRYWDYHQYQAIQDADLGVGAIRAVLKAIETDPVLHEEPPRDARAAEVMAAWMDAGHRVEVVTARHRHSEDVTRAFLRHHGIPHHALRMEAGVKTGYDLLVDDAPHNVLMAAADGGLALLMDHPYNRDVPTHTNPIRVEDWGVVGRVADEVLRPGRDAHRLSGWSLTGQSLRHDEPRRADRKQPDSGEGYMGSMKAASPVVPTSPPRAVQRGRGGCRAIGGRQRW